MRRLPQQSTEDVIIQYFKTDPKTGALQVFQTAFVVPLNTGEFAASAMGKGFIEHLAIPLDGPEPSKKMKDLIEENTIDAQVPIVDIALPLFQEYHEVPWLYFMHN